MLLVLNGDYMSIMVSVVNRDLIRYHRILDNTRIEVIERFTELDINALCELMDVILFGINTPEYYLVSLTDMINDGLTVGIGGIELDKLLSKLHNLNPLTVNIFLYNSSSSF